MAEYTYDEGGSMAAYFALSFLILILLPMSFSYMPSYKMFTKTKVVSCECVECEKHRVELRKANRRSFTSPSGKALFVIIGWIAVAGLCYIVTTTKDETKIYNPFEILGISHGSEESDIKRRFKRLSMQFHPDKVKLGVNETMEMIEAKFVEITKAYKSLTDETIRKNWEQYGHPDGRQETTMGIAIPKWMVEGKNNIWVLGAYAILFGGSLPFIVGKWWFGARSYTKDGVHAKSAETFFKDAREDSSMDEIIHLLGKVWKFEKFSSKRAGSEAELEGLEKKIEANTDVGAAWIQRTDDPLVKRAVILLYAHLLRLPIESSFLRQEQREILRHSITLLTSLLNITLSRNWLNTSLHVMHLHANLTQAVKPSEQAANDLLQYPGIGTKDVSGLGEDSMAWNNQVTRLENLVRKLKEEGDPRAEAIQKAGERWGRLEVVDVYFKVIGERIVTPSSFVNLVIKARITPPMGPVTAKPFDPDHPNEGERKDTEFLIGRGEADTLTPAQVKSLGYAHAPHWPSLRRPQWWAVLGDDKSGKVVVAPLKLVDVPYAKGDGTAKDYRTWKIVFQAPNQIGLFTWKVRFVSDCFVGDDVVVDVALKIDDPALLETAAPAEDEISDPDEDTLAGQMAAMRGQKVKRIEDEEDDDDSTTDGDDNAESSSSSDSD